MQIVIIVIYIATAILSGCLLATPTNDLICKLSMAESFFEEITLSDNIYRIIASIIAIAVAIIMYLLIHENDKKESKLSFICIPLIPLITFILIALVGLIISFLYWAIIIVIILIILGFIGILMAFDEI